MCFHHSTLLDGGLLAYAINPIRTDKRDQSFHLHTNTSMLHTHTTMHSEVHLKISIGTEVNIPQAYVPFTLKARLYQEEYIETCEWLLDIPVEKLTVNWGGNMSF